jgi:cytochrome P450
MPREMTPAMDLQAHYGSVDVNRMFADTVLRCPHSDLAEVRGILVLPADEVQRYLADDRLTSTRRADPRLCSLPSEDRAVYTRLRAFLDKWPVFSDGVYHDRVRRGVVRGLSGALTPSVISAWERTAVNRLQRLDGSEFDWITEFAHPTALAVLETVVNEDVDQLHRWGRVVLHNLATPELDTARARSALEAIASLRDWLAARIDRPESPFVAELSRLWRDPDLGPDPATAVLAQVVTGAYDPTVAAVGVIGELLDAETIAAIPPVSLREEVFRFTTPFRFTSRFITRPMIVGGRRLDPGDRVLLGLTSANFDRGRYPDALRWRDRRGGCPSFSFGGGRHHCPGAGLARHAIGAVLRAMAVTGASFRVRAVEKEPELPILRYRHLAGRLTTRPLGHPTDTPAGHSSSRPEPVAPVPS